MDNFFFDLQRFVDATITAGDSATISGGKDVTKTFSVTTNGATVNYSIALNNAELAISTDADGTVKFNVTSGYAYDFMNTTTNTKGYFVLLGGYMRVNGQVVTLGENGPTLSGLMPVNKEFVDIRFSSNDDYYNAEIFSFGINTLSIGGFSYYTTIEYINDTPFAIKIDKTTGRTYDINISSENASSDTITCDDGNGAKSFALTNGTFTFAIDKDGSNLSFTGLEVGDSFQLGDVVYTRTAQAFKAVSYTTGETKFWDGVTLPNSSDEISMSDLNFDSGNFSDSNLVDGVDYCTYLNPGLVGLLVDGSTATQYTNVTPSSTGVEIGVGQLVNDNPPVVMEMPTRISEHNVTRMLIDITPPESSSSVLKIYFPFNSSDFNFLVTLSANGSLQVETFEGDSSLDTMDAINLADYEVDLEKPIRFAFQATFTDEIFTQTWISIEVGNYVYKKQLEDVSIPFDSSYKSMKFVSDTEGVVKISNIIVRDESVGQLIEQIVPLPVSTTDTDMAANNGTYTATQSGQTLLQAPDVSGLVATFKSSATVKNVLVVGNPAYKKSGTLNRLTCIDKANDTITAHNSIALGTSSLKAISDSWGFRDTTLNDLTNMQFGWKAEA